MPLLNHNSFRLQNSTILPMVVKLHGSILLYRVFLSIQFNVLNFKDEEISAGENVHLSKVVVQIYLESQISQTSIALAAYSISKW